ncbi:MAG TPA: glycosyltransferase family 4 protein [Edaphocola sp.]|nr:glycosyltransferase family 4 protein [Edaphocola sp.]
MTKICFISPSLHQGGLENAVSVMANEMSRRGHEVSVLCIYDNPIFYKLDSNINIIIPPYLRGSFSTLRYYWKTVRFLRKQLKEIKPDVVVSYGDYINMISILAVRGLGIPIFISDRSSPGKAFPLIVKKMREFLYPMATGIIAQTQTAKLQKQKMLRNYSNIAIIPNPIRPISEHPEIEKENIILGVGRHYHVKGLDRLLRAYALLEDKSWRLMIAGNYGPNTEVLVNLAKELNIDEQVEFLGPIKEIDSLYKKSKIFVLSSRSEGFPNALIEAMAHGLACVSYDINAGPSDIIDNLKNGILVEDGDIPELALQIDFLIANPQERKRLSSNALTIKEKLSVQKIGNDFYNFITKKNIPS